MKLFSTFWCTLSLFVSAYTIPVNLLYDYDGPGTTQLPKGADVSSGEINLRVPIKFFGISFDTIYVNSNGVLSFQLAIPNFFNIEFPLDFPCIAPFYSHVDTSAAGTITYYETDDPQTLQRATENVHEAFINEGDFQATNCFIVTWYEVGYYHKKANKTNTYQVVIATDGERTFVELLYPENGLQWIQGTGDESGLPDARAQAGFVSIEGDYYTLPGSGMEQVYFLEKWSNINLDGQWLFRVDDAIIKEPDQYNDAFSLKRAPATCPQYPLYCHVQASCIDYETGFCCECKRDYYGNGKSCIKKDVPIRVNGKVSGKINGEKFEHLDLQSYILMVDARAYTAISRIPESIGADFQSLQILGATLGFLFAKPLKTAKNGYQITGGVFNHTATLKFLKTNQTVFIKQKFLGLDVFDQLKFESEIQGEIPEIDSNATTVDNYQEEYKLTNPGVLQMSSMRKFSFKNSYGEDLEHEYLLEQVYTFNYCKHHEEIERGVVWKLKVGKNFITYDPTQQIARFGLSNKIVPFGDFDPCEEGRTQCQPNSACVVENDSFRCVCNPGYQNIYSGNQTICADLDECALHLHDCDYNAQCINEIGGYACECNPGFEGDGHICQNAVTCQSVRCNENAYCEEYTGVAACRCLPGFTGDGQVCTPITSRSCHIVNNCSPYGMCTLNADRNEYFCMCLPGYTGNGYVCEVEQEITTTVATNDITTVPKKCLLGVCWCPSGYTVDNQSDMCVWNSDAATTTTESPTGEVTTMYPDTVSCNVRNNCHPYAQCIYSEDLGDYMCVCNAGFEGDGIFCDYVSCTQVDNCDPHGTCTYNETVGKSHCACNSGFVGDGHTCITAICTSNEDCTETEECLYTPAQRYECVCKEGYTRDSQHQCVILTGTCGGGTCAENAECLFDEEYETFYCTCNAGFVGDGITECKPRTIGCNELNNCGQHAACEYDELSMTYQCRCSEGFYGDGFNCYAQKNCHVDPNLCDYHALCQTDANRNYICVCNTGYIGNGTVCKEIRRHQGNFLLLNQGMATLRIPFNPTPTNPGKPIQIKSYQTAVSIDVDCIEGKVYWGDVSGGAIRSASYNGSDKVDFITKDIGSPEGIAIDWVSRNIYWTDSTRDTVEIASLDSKRRKTLVSTGLVNPRGIAVHPQRGKIFWTDWNREDPKIEWANADGTGRDIFYKVEAISLPNSLAIDYDMEQLCYTDAGTKKVECINIDTRERQTISSECNYPFGIAITDKHIYWSDWVKKVIEKIDKYTLKQEPSLKVPLGGSGNKLFGLVAVPEGCEPLTNVCQYYKDQCPAEHICVPDGAGSRRCLCTYNADDPSEQPSCSL